MGHYEAAIDALLERGDLPPEQGTALRVLRGLPAHGPEEGAWRALWEAVRAFEEICVETQGRSEVSE